MPYSLRRFNCADVDRWRTNADVVPSFSFIIALHLLQLADAIFVDVSTGYFDDVLSGWSTKSLVVSQ